MKAYSMAIVGAGISGLTLALQLQKLSNLKINIFEKQKINGGRILSQHLFNQTYSDLGANYFDFQNTKQQEAVRKFMDGIGNQHYSKRFQQFQQPFLIFENEKLMKSDKYKPRYFYQKGFVKFLQDLKQNLNKQCSILHNHQVAKISKLNDKWTLIDSHDKQHENTYDFVVLGCSGVDSSTILINSKVPELLELYQLVNSIKYTRQISAVFQLKEHSHFSSILFKNHAISFISSHQQKYSGQHPSIAVIQLSENFSELHWQKSQKQIAELIKQEIPKILEEYFGKCLGIKCWYPSLIKNRNSGNFDKFQREQQGVFVTGDVVYGSSRVTGAMEVSLQLSKLINKKLNPSL